MISADGRSARPTAVAERELLDAVWARVEPLVPPSKPSPLGGRPRAGDRPCVEGVVDVLRSGCRWRDLPRPYPSDSTCWRRHRDWCEAGVRERLVAARKGCRRKTGNNSGMSLVAFPQLPQP